MVTQTSSELSGTPKSIPREVGPQTKASGASADHAPTSHTRAALGTHALLVLLGVLAGCGSVPPGTVPTAPDGMVAAEDAAHDTPSFDLMLPTDRAVPGDEGALDAPLDDQLAFDSSLDREAVADLPLEDADHSDDGAALDVADTVRAEAGCTSTEIRCGSTCTDLRNDPLNCGGCGISCRDVPGVAPDRVRCEAGRCVIEGACAADRGDCDGEATNGCEADLSTALDCGRCGATCSGATPACTMAAADGGMARSCSSGCSAMTPVRCGGACVSLAEDLRNCGACGRVCTAPANARSTCAAGACGFACDAGFHLCEGRCVSTQSVDSCGASCTPCTAPANAVAACRSGACAFDCTPLHHICGGACVPDDDARTCGTSCAPCPTVSNGRAVCRSGRCGAACDVGFHACGAACASNAAPESCGTRCEPCPAPPENGRASCDGVTCGIACDDGFGLVGGACVLTAPRLIAPPSTSTATSHRPVLRWMLDRPGPVTVRLCRNRALTMGCVVLSSSSLSASPTSALSPGVWFWRVERAVGATSATSATWEFFVGARSAAVAAAWGTVPDFNGDGLADILIGSQYAAPVTVYHGSSPAPSATPTYSLNDSREPGDAYGSSVASAGDVNGDGYGDAVVGSSGAFYLYLGGPAGLIRPYAQRVIGETILFGVPVTPAGDVNGDGYADVAVSSYLTSVSVYYGSARGLGLSTPLTLAAPSVASEYGRSLTSLDMDADGYSDLVVSAPATADPFTRPRIFLYRGNAVSLSTAPTIIIGASYSSLGKWVDNAGDVNGDGYGDLVASAHDANEVRVFQGGATIPTTSSSTIRAAPGIAFGNCAAGAGDVDGDGYSDLIASGFDVVHLHLGTPTGASGGPISSLTGPPYFGAPMAAAGDVNGDGYGDVMVGAQEFARLLLGSASGVGTMVIDFRPSSRGNGFGWAVAALERLRSRRVCRPT